MLKNLSAIVALLAFSQQAFAYLDPGTGSMILQGLIAGIAVAGFTIKNYWYKIRAYLGLGGSSSLLEEEDEAKGSE